MGGGTSEVLPLQKRGWVKKVLATMNGGTTKFYGSFNTGD